VATATGPPAGEGGIFFSTDNGETWTLTSNTPGLLDIVWNPGGFGNWIAVGDEVILTSPDGDAWTTQTFVDNFFTAVAADGFGNVLAVGEEGAAFISTDNGASFVAMDLPFETDFRAVAADGEGGWWVAGAGSLLRAEGTGSEPDVTVILDPDDLDLPLYEPEGLLLNGDAVLLAGVAFVPPPHIQAGTPDSNGHVEVTLLADQPGDERFFTLDGSVPEASDAYTGPFTLTASATVTALAFRQGIYSPLTSEEIVLSTDPPIRIQSIHVAGDTVTLVQNTSLTGTVYRLQYTQNLAANPQDWQDESVAEKNGGEASLTWEITPLPASPRFWRILQL
jgi:hypothetical protein